MHQICAKLKVKARNNDTGVILLILFLKSIICFSHCSSVYIVDFKQVNASWVKY